ncbi:Small auxin-up RNA [Dillenia turbinata]|uniref:Small auxin-up RNA n=1 Tax=Dillenia turbinata TaxID=194707 RepID=A0AAN8V3D6_9MAGN
MAKHRSNAKKKNGIVNLKIVVQKLQKSLSLVKKSTINLEDYEEISEANYVPEDVKEGHFAVIAVDDINEPKRFVVPLSYLTHPDFVRLLEQSAEVYGFDHEGALTVPCRPSELERILADRWEERHQSSSTVGVKWGVTYNTLVQSC